MQEQNDQIQSPLPEQGVAIKSPSLSPLAPKQENKNTVSFGEAMRKIADGMKVTKLEWADEKIYGVLNNTVLSIHKDGKFHPWTVSEGDLVGEDWVIL